MNESTPSPLSAASPLEPSAPAATVTAGVLLQQARERSGVHLGLLSVALKVPVRHLIALEADDHTPFSGPVFVRALTSSICRHLKVDAAPILDLLPRGETSLPSLPPSLEPSGPDWRVHFFGRLEGRHRLFLGLALVLMVLIALVIWMPQWPSGFVNSPQVPASVTGVAIETPLTAAPPSNPMVVLLPSEPASDIDAGRAAVNAKTLAVSSASTGMNAGLEITFKGKSDESWVEVKDHAGGMVFNKLVKPGETHVVKGVPVLTVVVGLADAVEVLVRGQPLDLTPFSRGAVARFEVK